MITEEKINYLKQIVSNEFQVDVSSLRRTRVHVDARLVYSYILRNRGLGLSRIGKSINKNHATVLYLLNNAPSYLKQDPDLKTKYDSCLLMFENHHSPVYDLTMPELQKAYVRLQANHDILVEEKEILMEEIHDLKEKLKLEELH
tara:strand:- start:1127 stop:1561 length:435 start_codon:yes stop_codon:yes gene_type:complete